MITSLLIANRGEIASRIIRSARDLGIKTIAVASPQDRQALYTHQADHTVILPDGPAAANYLNQDEIIASALQHGAEAIHPGYGFLSENAEFAQAVIDAGLIFVGPPAKVIAQMGQKDRAKKIMAENGVPVVPGYLGDNQDSDNLAMEAEKIGFPVLIKAVSGGGGKGMRRVDDPADFRIALESAQREASASFGDARVLIEKYIQTPRHIEVQILSDHFGHHLHLFERDCSLQRRHQKVIEEAPAPNMPESVRQAMTEAALHAARAIGYQNAGTVEFIADATNGLTEDGFWFMEMNTRLQVEHPVTEAVTGIDLVKAQLEIASNLPLSFSQDDVTLKGHAVETRLYAEDPAADFRPTPGKMQAIIFPTATGLRIDSGVQSGDTISSSYDPMIAKIITHQATRELAFRQSAAHLGHILSIGTKTNQDFLQRLCELQCKDSTVSTGLIAERQAELTSLENPRPKAVLAAAIALIVKQKIHYLGWRQWGDATIPFSFMLADQTETIDCHILFSSAQQIQFQMGEACLDCTDFSITPLPSGVQIMRAIVDGVAFSAHILTEGPYLCISSENRLLRLKQAEKSAETHTSQASNEICAPMSAVVREVHVKRGQKVTAEQRLVSVEAMKMEYPLLAPFAGTVEEIKCLPGDNVSEAQYLIRLSRDESKDSSDG